MIETVNGTGYRIIRIETSRESRIQNEKWLRYGGRSRT